VLVDANGDCRIHLSQQETSCWMEGAEAASVAQGVVVRQKGEFRAADAVSWNGGQPLSWEDVVRPSLQTLVDRGFLAVRA
jgi:hypothetical protein